MAITCARVSAVPVARARRSVSRLFLNHHSASILRLVGSPKTPVRDRLDVWPDLSLIIYDSSTINPPDNINRSRVSILLGKLLARPKFACGKVSAAMQVPFPELTELRLNLYDHDEWVPDCQSAQSSAIRSWVDPLHVCELSS